jgi:calpain-7
VGATRVRLLQIKNPWSRKRWLGRYSPADDVSWTAALRQALHYDLEANKREDNGVFWIDYDDLCRYFSVINLNWSPALFQHQLT